MAKRRNLDNHFLLTASDLAGGQILYWSAAKGWTERYTDAQFVSGAEAVAGLEAVAQRDEATNKIVGGYLIEFARQASGAFEPVELRERQRLLGPSITYGTAVQEPVRLAA